MERLAWITRDVSRAGRLIGGVGRATARNIEKKIERRERKAGSVMNLDEERGPFTGEATGRDRETLLLMSSKNAEIHHPVSDGHLSSRPTPEARGAQEEGWREGEGGRGGEGEKVRRQSEPIHRHRVHSVINGFTILEISWKQSSRIRSGVKTKGRSPPLRSRWPPIRSRFHDTHVFTIDPPRPSGYTRG